MRRDSSHDQVLTWISLLLRYDRVQLRKKVNNFMYIDVLRIGLRTFYMHQVKHAFFDISRSFFVEVRLHNWQGNSWRAKTLPRGPSPSQAHNHPPNFKSHNFKRSRSGSHLTPSHLAQRYAVGFLMSIAR